MDEALTVPAGGGRWAPVRLLGDERLAQLAASGDRNAFGEIYRRYHQELYRYCRTIIGCPDEAQDALQSTMVSVLRALPGESRTIALRPWLYRIAHNESITLVRQRSAFIPTDQVPEQADPRAEHHVEHRERLRELLGDLESLPDRQRGALTMRELSGMGYAEIGASLGLSDAAARQAVYEARCALQELSEGREMECEAARQALSSEDRRVLRGRKLRAHLRACAGCRSFNAAIERRRTELASLAPPLPAAAAAGLLQAALGSGGAAVGAGAAAAGAGGGGGSLLGILGAAASKGAAGSMAAKSLAAAVAAGAIGAGAGGVGGLADGPLIGGPGGGEATPAALPRGAHSVSGGSTATDHGSPTAPTGAGAARGPGARGGRGSGGEGSQRGRGRHAASPGAGAGPSGGPGPTPGQGQAANPSTAPQAPAAGQPGPPAHAEGLGPSNGGSSGASSPGQSGSPPPGHGGSPPGQGAQGSPPGQSSSPPAAQGPPPGQQAGGSASHAQAAPPGGGPPSNSAASSGPPGQSTSGPPGQTKK